MPVVSGGTATVSTIVHMEIQHCNLSKAASSFRSPNLSNGRAA